MQLTDYVVSFTTSSSTILNVVVYYDENKNFISRSVQSGLSTFTTPENCKYVRLVFNKNEGTGDISNIQLEQGLIETEHEEHIDTTINAKENGSFNEILNIDGISYRIGDLEKVENISSKFNINAKFKTKELKVTKTGRVISIRFYGILGEAVNGYTNLLDTNYFTIPNVIFFPLFNVTTGSWKVGQCGYEDGKSYFYSRTDLSADTTVSFYITFII